MRVVVILDVQYEIQQLVNSVTVSSTKQDCTVMYYINEI
jgi:hypothetical protein